MARRPPRADDHGEDDRPAMSRLTLSDLPSAETRRSARRTQGRDRLRRRRRRALRALVVTLVALGLLGGGVVLAADPLRDLVAQLTEPNDFEGAGTGEVQVRVEAGDTGSDIGATLAEAGVVKTAEAFVEQASTDPRASSIAPGTYALREQMSAAAALDLLLDPAALKNFSVTIPEGFTAEEALQRTAEATGTSVEALRTASADPAVGLPLEAGGSLEGYLFPATYTFDLAVTEVQVLATMVARAQQATDAAGVPAERRHEVLTIASLVQAEAGNEADMAKVSQVIANRLSTGMALQFDTTVNYATSKKGLTTSDADRATDSPYNTYLYPGLPPGPINNPGDAALAAALAPEPGDWLFFVVVDPDTGETRFAVTKEEHDANVKIFQAWYRENQGS